MKEIGSLGCGIGGRKSVLAPLGSNSGYWSIEGRGVSRSIRAKFLLRLVMAVIELSQSIRLVLLFRLEGLCQSFPPGSADPPRLEGDSKSMPLWSNS